MRYKHNCPEHDPCEGHSLHIRARCDNGCPQFQDGSWYDRPWCREPHPDGPRGGGDAGDTKAWLEFELRH